MNIDEFKKFNNLPKSYWIASTHETNHPVLDKDIDVDLVIIGGGMVGISCAYRKWGMTNSTVSSIILRDLIINGKSPWMDVYNPSRKTLGASAKNFIVQNVNVAGQLLDGKRAGAYRDEEGNLHLVNTTCTHMGCENNWNEAEKSWDCPCHGSRFSIDGDVIDGPAVSPLSFDNDVNTIKKVIKEDY